MKIKSFNLMALSQSQIKEKEMSLLSGGAAPGTCGCGCPGPSSNYQNGYSNHSGGVASSGTRAWNCHCTSSDLSFTEFAFFGCINPN